MKDNPLNFNGASNWGSGESADTKEDQSQGTQTTAQQLKTAKTSLRNFKIATAALGVSVLALLVWTMAN